MSGFMMSPIGFVIVLTYSAVILLVVRLLGRAVGAFQHRWWVLAPPAAILLALPWAEESWIAWHFNKACVGTGVTVYRQVYVDGFYDGTVGTGYSFIEDHGFRFMEEKGKGQKVAHTERINGKWITSLLDAPQARYHVVYAYRPNSASHEEPIGWQLEKVERQALDSKTGEVLGRELRVNRGLPIHEALWARHFGPAIMSCPTGTQPDFLQSIFMPIAIH